MQSTTSEIDRLVPAESAAEAPLLEGLTVLRNLVGHVSLPTAQRQEELALAALEWLLDHRDCREAIGQSRDDLMKEVELLKRDDIMALVRWIHPEGWTRQVIWRRRNRHRQRCLHLLVLLARVVAPVSRFVVIPVLSDLGLCPDREGCHRTLTWLSRWTRRDSIGLVRRYLEITRRVWFDEFARPAGVRAIERLAQFSSWPWQQQLLELLAWRAVWDGESGEGPGERQVNPAIVAGTIEFGLARQQSYRKLRRAGGRLASQILRELGYTDYRLRYARGRMRLVVISLIIVAMAIGVAINGSRRAAVWDESNIDLAKRANHMLARTASTVPLPARPVGDAPNGPSDLNRTDGRVGLLTGE